MRHLVITLVALAVLAGTVLPRFLLQAPPPAPPAQAAAPAVALPGPLRDALAGDTPLVVWTAHSGARLEPCGCVAGMHGGLVRRATLLAAIPRERRLTLELGGWSGGSADYQVARAGFFIEGLALAGTDAMALGTAESRLPPQHLTQLVATARRHGVVPLDATGLGGAERIHHVTRGGRRFALTAVHGPDPAAAVLAVQPLAQGASLVVCADLDEAAIRQLALAVPGIALVVGGEVAGPSLAPVALGAARAVWAANHGKTLAVWPWGQPACAFALITDDIPDHPAQRALVHRYQEHLAGMELVLDERIAGLTAIGAARQARYAGDAACTECHGEAAQVHAASRHPHAFAALRAKGYHQDPECLRCHVIALGLPDGFQRRQPRPERALVGCESCHGPAAEHVAAYREQRPPAATLDPVTPATCLGCHDAENSPKFTYESYWPRIAHTGARGR